MNNPIITALAGIADKVNDDSVKRHLRAAAVRLVNVEVEQAFGPLPPRPPRNRVFNEVKAKAPHYPDSMTVENTTFR